MSSSSFGRSHPPRTGESCEGTREAGAGRLRKAPRLRCLVDTVYRRGGPHSARDCRIKGGGADAVSEAEDGGASGTQAARNAATAGSNVRATRKRRVGV